MTTLVRLFSLAILGLCASAGAVAQPIPGVEPARSVPGAEIVPDPNQTYNVVFDVVAAAPEVGAVNPGLLGVARFVNTLAKFGVPAEKRKIAAVIHRDATDIIVNNETFKARNGGRDNPNLALMQALTEAGVDLRVCGQAVLAKDIDPKTIVPEVHLDLWALTTFVALEQQGYVRVGGGG
jgi:intracellular sulfur oxidation DsrE/DsrF family protein